MLHIKDLVPIEPTEAMSTATPMLSWQCLKLERLHLCFEEPCQDKGDNTREESIPATAEDQSPLVGIPKVLWQQISKLERLEELRLRRVASPSEGHTGTEAIPSLNKPKLDLLPTTPTTRDQFREVLEDWHKSLLRLRRIQLRGLYPFVDPVAWRHYRQNNFLRLEWARLK